MTTIILAIVIGGAFGFVLDRIGATNPGYIIRMLNLSNLHLGRGDYAKARTYAQEAVTMFKGTSNGAMRRRARATLRLCIASRKLDPAEIAVGEGAVEHCTDAVVRTKEADVPPAEVFRAMKELALALETQGDTDGAKRTAREALAGAQSEADRQDAIALLNRLEQ